MRICKMVVGILLLACASTALAQTSVDRSFKVTSKDCSGVQWTREALAVYPNLASACQAVEERDGKTYVKFHGTVQRNVDRGKQLEVRIKGGDTIKLAPPETMTVYVNDRKTPVSQLERGDALNFYVPEDRFAAQFAQDTTPTPRLVVVPIVYRETVYEEPQETRTAAALPATATNRGWMLLTALGMIGLAMAFTLIRLRDGRP